MPSGGRSGASTKPPRARTRLPAAVWLFGLASLLNDASSEAIFPLLGLFLSTMGTPMQFVGLVLGLADAIAAGIKIAAGRWSDRVRRRPLVIAGYLVAAAGRAALAISATPTQVLAARSLDRAGKAIRSGPRDAMLTDAVGVAERGRAFGVQKAMDHAGAACGPLIASACLTAGMSLRATFGVAAALGVAAPLLLAWRLREIPRSSASVDRDTAAIALSAETKSTRPLSAYLCACAVFALANSSDAFILMRAADLGWAPAVVPLLWLAHHGVKSITAAIGGFLSDRISRVWLIVGGWMAYAVAYTGFALADRRWHVVALLVFYAAYHGLAEAPERALVSDLAGVGRRGYAFGLYHGVVGLAALPAGLLMGGLWDRFGAGAAFGACAGLAFLAAALMFALLRYGPLRPNSAPASS